MNMSTAARPLAAGIALLIAANAHAETFDISVSGGTGSSAFSLTGTLSTTLQGQPSPTSALYQITGVNAQFTNSAGLAQVMFDAAGPILTQGSAVMLNGLDFWNDVIIGGVSGDAIKNGAESSYRLLGPTLTRVGGTGVPAANLTVTQGSGNSFSLTASGGSGSDAFSMTATLTTALQTQLSSDAAVYSITGVAGTFTDAHGNGELHLDGAATLTVLGTNVVLGQLGFWNDHYINGTTTGDAIKNGYDDSYVLGGANLIDKAGGAPIPAVLSLSLDVPNTDPGQGGGDPPATDVPVPPSLALLGSGLAMLGMLRRRVTAAGA